MYMGEALQGVREAWTGQWGLGYRAVGRDFGVCVHQGICHSCQRFQRRAENLSESTHPIGRIRPIQMMRPSSPGSNGMTYANAPTCNNVAVMERVCNIQFGHPDRTLEQVHLPNRLYDAGGGPTKLKQLRRGLPVGGIVDAGHV